MKPKPIFNKVVIFSDDTGDFAGTAELALEKFGYSRETIVESKDFNFSKKRSADYKLLVIAETESLRNEQKACFYSLLISRLSQDYYEILADDVFAESHKLDWQINSIAKKSADGSDINLIANADSNIQQHLLEIGCAFSEEFKTERNLTSGLEGWGELFLDTVSCFDSRFNSGYKIDVSKHFEIMQFIARDKYENLKVFIKSRFNFADWFELQPPLDGRNIKRSPLLPNPGYSPAEYAYCYAEACINVVLSAITVRAKRIKNLSIELWEKDKTQETKLYQLIKRAEEFISLSRNITLNNERINHFFKETGLAPETTG